MRLNEERTGTDSCILFAPQDDRCTGNKNLAANLTGIIEKMVDIKETKFFEDFIEKIRFEKADRGVKVIIPGRSKTGEVLVTNYDTYSSDDIDKKTLDIVECLDTEVHREFPAYVKLNIVKKSIEIKNSEGGKYWDRARKKYLCSAEKLAAYITFASRVRNGVNISRYSKDSLNILLFYIRALALTSGMGPAYWGSINVNNGKVRTPACEFLEACENDGKVYVKAEYADVSLPPEAKELADAILMLAPDGPDADDEIKKSLDYHPCYTGKFGRKIKVCTIEDGEIIADFSTWEAAKKACDKKIRLLTGSSVSQLALPLFS